MKKVSLKNIRILFFSQYFFGYEKKIKEKMEELGAAVDIYDERSIKSAFDRAIIKFFPYLYTRKTRRYYENIINEVKNNSYDYILFIDCEMPSIDDLKTIKRTFPSAKLCLHLWDSLSNLKGVETKLCIFDYVTSFDKCDSERLSLIFRPLFFCDDYVGKETNSTKSHRYNVSFIGTIHSDRFAVIQKVSKQISKDKFFVYPYLQSKFIYYFYKLTKKEFKNTKITDFCFDKIESKRIAQITNESSAVLDIQHPGQSGLTMRTLEMVGMKKKFITTNKDIVNYDFYNKKNIMVIDRENPLIESSFFDSDYDEVPQEIYDKYYIECWIKEVLGLDG